MLRRIGTDSARSREPNLPGPYTLPRLLFSQGLAYTNTTAILCGFASLREARRATEVSMCASALKLKTARKLCLLYPHQIFRKLLGL